MKVIGAGFCRTGTNSLHLALTKLGYNTLHMKVLIEREDLDPDQFTEAWLHPEKADFDKLFAGFDAGVDHPTCDLLVPLMNKYPDAKVILTVRDADKWYDSVYKTCYPSQQAFDYRSKDFPRLGKLKRMNETTVLDGAFGDPERMNDRETIIRMFNERNEWVKANVPADRLLVMELGVDGWEKLCAFLGKEVPDEPYPKSNSRQEFEEMMRLFIQDGQDGRAVMESAMAQLKRQKSTT